MPPNPGEDRCDFCSSTVCPWTHYVRPGTGTDWGACPTCHEIILAGDAAALLERSVNTIPGAAGPREMRRLLRQKINALHAHFWKDRTGEFTYDYHLADGETQRSTP